MPRNNNNGNILSMWLETHGVAPDSLKDRAVYAVKRKNASEHTVFNGHVTKKGREYITTDMFWNARFRVRDLADPFLIDADSAGFVDLLFLDKPSLDEYLCQEQRASELRDKLNGYCAKASSWQLFAAMSVMDNASELTCKAILDLIQTQLDEDEKRRKRHAAKLSVKQARIRKYGGLMSAGAVDYGKEKIGAYSVLETWSAKFDDGSRLDIKMWSGHDGIPPWIEAELYRDGVHLADISIERKFPEKITVEYGGETYTAEIVPS